MPDPKKITLSIGADHAGFVLKEHLRAQLESWGYPVADQGCFGPQSVNYPDFGKAVAKQVAGGAVDRGLLICGSGIGMSITANRFKGIRATLCHDLETSRLSRQHNDSNLLVLGARALAETRAVEILRIWLDTPFEGGRHQTRLDLIDQP